MPRNCCSRPSKTDGFAARHRKRSRLQRRNRFFSGFNKAAGYKIFFEKSKLFYLLIYDAGHYLYKIAVAFTDGVFCRAHALAVYQKHSVHGGQSPFRCRPHGSEFCGNYAVGFYKIGNKIHRRLAASQTIAKVEMHKNLFAVRLSVRNNLFKRIYFAFYKKDDVGRRIDGAFKLFAGVRRADERIFFDNR